MPYLGTFGLEFGKSIVISEIITLEYHENKSLTHAVNFGIGSAFHKGLGSGFSEGPCPGPGPLYRVYLPISIKALDISRNTSRVSRVGLQSKLENMS